jgi:hypothetical protein
LLVVIFWVFFFDSFLNGHFIDLSEQTQQIVQSFVSVIFGIDPVYIQFEDSGLDRCADELVFEFNVIFKELNDKGFLLRVH